MGWKKEEPGPAREEWDVEWKLLQPLLTKKFPSVKGQMGWSSEGLEDRGMALISKATSVTPPLRNHGVSVLKKSEKN